jgi:hypothetical protein
VIELPALRTYTRKVFEIDDKKRLYCFHTAHQHYKNSGGVFTSIDTTLNFNASSKTFRQDMASYSCELPEYADEKFSFHNKFEGADLSLWAIPQCAHVQGESYKDEDGAYILYKDAFGIDIDLKVFAYWGGLRKVICVNKKPLNTTRDLSFDFELQTPSSAKVISSKGEWDRSNILDFSGGILKVGDGEKFSYFSKSYVWDSSNTRMPINIQLLRKNGKTYIRKTLTSEFLKSAVYPVFTDHPTTYVGTGGDGNVSTTSSVWDTAHDATVGTSVDNSYIRCGVDHASFPSQNKSIYRGFIPIDSSGISGVVSAASLFLYVGFKYNNDDDGDDWINIVQTSQASTSELVVEDYDQCGAVDNPTEGGTRQDITSITTSSYNEFPLNETGYEWIVDGTSMLGIREGHDALDHPTLADSLIGVIASEGDNDPYLEVTTASASRFMTCNKRMW